MNCFARNRGMASILLINLVLPVHTSDIMTLSTYFRFNMPSFVVQICTVFVERPMTSQTRSNHEYRCAFSHFKLFSKHMACIRKLINTNHAFMVAFNRSLSHFFIQFIWSFKLRTYILILSRSFRCYLLIYTGRTDAVCGLDPILRHVGAVPDFQHNRQLLGFDAHRHDRRRSDDHGTVVRSLVDVQQCTEPADVRLHVQVRRCAFNNTLKLVTLKAP